MMVGGYDVFSLGTVSSARMIGAIYGAFVEIDDASGEDAKALAAAREKAPAKQLKKG